MKYDLEDVFCDEFPTDLNSMQFFLEDRISKFIKVFNKEPTIALSLDVYKNCIKALSLQYTGTFFIDLAQKSNYDFSFRVGNMQLNVVNDKRLRNSCIICDTTIFLNLIEYIHQFPQCVSDKHFNEVVNYEFEKVILHGKEN